MPGINSIDGIVSNLDTTSIIDAIIAAERVNVDLLTVRQTERTNELTTYQSINALMVGLKSQVTALTRRTAFEKFAVDISDDTKIGVEVTGRAALGSYSLSVTQLAANHQIATQGYADPTATVGTGTFTVQIGSGSSSTLTIDANNNTLTGLKTAINNANLGVRATVVNDGTSKNNYRLMLTADKTGAANKITVTHTLTGGTTPDFIGTSFDLPETDGLSLASTSAVSLGTTASYSGSANKTYTFTVQGSGTQTVGSGPITVNWTDGTNSGSIVVNEADTDVALAGTGSDGLILSFGSGGLVAGDTFSVQTFAPTLQEAQDAKVALGSTTGSGSPIVVSSATNTIDDLLEGMKLTLKDVTTTPVSLQVHLDNGGVKDTIQSVLAQYNEVMKAIDKQFTFNSETNEAGALLGDQFLLAIQSNLRGTVTGVIDTLPQSMNMLQSVGINTTTTGELAIAFNSLFNEKLEHSYEDFVRLFIDSGVSSNDKIAYLASSAKTVETSDGYEVRITRAAKHGRMQAAEINSPVTHPITLTSSNNTVQLIIDGLVSDEIVLTEKTYATGADLQKELQAKVDADAKLKGRGVVVAYQDNGSTGHFTITSGTYGSSSTVAFKLGIADSAATALGLATGQSIAGEDVEGTINGEEAIGTGRILAGKEGNSLTDGLRLEINLVDGEFTPSAVAGTITFGRGFASRLDRTLESLTNSIDGTFARRTGAIQSQIDDLADQITDMEERLDVRRGKLFQQFYEMELALNEFQSQGLFLSDQLSFLAGNLQTIQSNSLGG